MKFALLAAALIAAPAAATTIDFDSQHNASGSYNYIYGPYNEDGFTLTASSCANTSQGSLCYITPQSFQSIDAAGAAFVNYNGGAFSTLTKTGGGSFTLTSLDISEYFDDLSYGTGTMSALFRFAFADGTSSQQTITFNTRGRYPVTTLTFNLAPLTSFGFSPTDGTSGFLQFDNIVVNAGTAAVPEPASWALMIGGFGLVGGAMRKRRTAIVFG